MSGDIFNQGLNLMAFGMGTVFVFLTLLVIATSIMSNIISSYFPEAIAKPKSPSVATKKGDDKQVISAIMAAIKLHRSQKNK